MKFDRITKCTAEAFSQPPQFDMLNFFMELRRKPKKNTIDEKWVQREIVRKLYREKFDVDPKEKKHGYDFEVFERVTHRVC